MTRKVMEHYAEWAGSKTPCCNRFSSL